MSRKVISVCRTVFDCGIGADRWPSFKLGLAIDQESQLDLFLVVLHQQSKIRVSHKDNRPSRGIELRIGIRFECGFRTERCTPNCECEAEEEQRDY